MPNVVEGATEGLTAWQQLAGAAAIFLTTAAGVLTRFLAKKSEPEAAGVSGKHVVLEQATLADAGPFTSMANDIAAIRGLMEDQVEAQERRREEEAEQRVKDDMDRMRKEIEDLKRGGAKHAPGRPLRDA